jgi:long-subunit acyl-CoA synthetase (AMP-forming)
MKPWPYSPAFSASIALGDRLLYRLGNVLIYGPLRNVLGMSRIRVAYTAGAAIGPDLFRFYRSIGVNLKQLYGATETCAAVCLQPDREIKFDSVGKPAPGVEVKISDGGEVLVRGDTVMSGYWNNAAASAETLRNGWLHTGDLGVCDEEGFLTLKDRNKDVIISGGSNIYPREVEEVLLRHPGVLESSVIGGPDAEWGENVIAFVVAKPGAQVAASGGQAPSAAGSWPARPRSRQPSERRSARPELEAQPEPPGQA